MQNNRAALGWEIRELAREGLSQLSVRAVSLVEKTELSSWWSEGDTFSSVRAWADGWLVALEKRWRHHRLFVCTFSSCSSGVKT